MENNIKISKALSALAQVADEVLHPTSAARSALNGNKLAPAQRQLLERIDGFRSLEQVLSISGDIVGVHAALGRLMVDGLVSADPRAPMAAPQPVIAKSAATAAPVAAPAARPVAPKPAVAKPVAPVVARPVAVPALAKPVAVTAPAKPVAAPAPVKAIAVSAPAKPVTAPAPAKPAVSEVDAAKRLLALEAKHLLGEGATRLQPRIDACRSIEEVYDLIVKFQQHLSKTGRANPDVFLDRLTKGLERVRKQQPAPSRPAA